MTGGLFCYVKFIKGKKLDISKIQSYKRKHNSNKTGKVCWRALLRGTKQREAAMSGDRSILYRSGGEGEGSHIYFCCEFAGRRGAKAPGAVWKIRFWAKI